MTIDEDAFEEVNGIHRPKPGKSHLVKKMMELWDRMEEDFERGKDEVVEYYMPEKHYHLVGDDPSFTMCNIPMIEVPEQGRWVFGTSLQSERTPCPNCLKARMEIEDSEYQEEEYYD